MNNLLVSYIIPCYNKEDYLKDCLDSVLAQDYRSIEIILVDDGSTDRSAEIYSAYEGDKCKVVSFTQNKGLGNALSVGYRKASGDYLCFLSADDMLIDPDKTLIQVAAMNNDPSLDLTFYNQFEMGKSLTSLREIVRIPMWCNHILLHNNLLFLALREHNFIGSVSLMHRRDSYFRLGEWDPALRNANDHDLLLKQILAGARIRMLEGDVAFYRLNPDQLSKDKNFLQDVEEVNKYWKEKVLNGKYPLLLKAGVFLL